ncbi:ATP-dependent DNA helicase [Aaosphaeria arxii CBS 175.79]|uniref:ATP-dependent DNA helicase n=1 Tax=Aaosphaeria arxii CBS 175.79 TaxID=1450172 RepID=A0A6A5XSJ0_9PLEO|nr:ATP-dependent DNA helicase [Aaosphaeria arxii CBS 175.79]KAF2015869.1 ATP-dependent DNA helicase [Aaosphaeria arxii CBS 175.79]
MATVHVVADVKSAHAHDAAIKYLAPNHGPSFGRRERPLEEWNLAGPDISTLPDPLTTIWKCLAPNGSEQSTSGNQPPPKRRKSNNGGSVGLQSVDDFDESRSVVLARVSIDLKFPAATLTPKSSPTSTNTPPQSLAVTFEQFSQLSEHEFRFTIWNPENPRTGIDLIATTAQSITPAQSHLKTIGRDQCTTENGRKRVVKLGASFSRCVVRHTNSGNLRLDAELRYLVGFPIVESMPASSSVVKKDTEYLQRYLPDPSGEVTKPWQLSDFYDAVHVPPQDLEVSPHIDKSLLETPLFPFQQRAVDWLLRREGVAFGSQGLQPLGIPPPPPVSFRSIQDADGKDCCVSDARGLIVRDTGSVSDGSVSIKGGILAEEMGLGKTVEMIALISHHKRLIQEENVFDSYTGTTVKASGSTLIITPPSILHQWKKEINSHAPELKVLHYQGLPAATAPRKEHAKATVEYLMEFDIILTTYAVLSREVHFAKPPPDRSLRTEKRHPARRSPLVEISWWRVCLDEAQMVESGVSQAATVARLIPRCNAWAVSGTPLAKNIHDLRGLLMFLRYEPFASHKGVWDRLDQNSFQTLFNQITLRHSKDRIRDELRLPPQKRVVITMPFTAIEEQNYSEMIRHMCDTCGLSPEGNPTSDDYDPADPEILERMRDWLVRLRQTCLHAHVGRKNRKALGAKNGPLRTVHEVLEVMIEQNDTNLKAEAREYILARMRSGHVKGNAKDNEQRSETALPYYEHALADAENYVAICRSELAVEKEKLGATIDEELEAGEDDADEKNLGRLPTIRKSLRSFLELEHACRFFIGTSYYQKKINENLTKPDSENFHVLEKLEVEWYDKAKVIRRELLRDSERRAQQHMKRITLRKPFQQLPEVKDLEDLGGIESRKILDTMDSISDLLNAQAKQLKTWRQKVVDILLMPLVDEDEEGKETTGEEYEDSTKVQDELYVYIMALRTLIADRSTMVNGLNDILVDHELKMAEAAARSTEEPRGHAPELVLEVVKIRSELKPTAIVGSLKGVISGVRSLITSLQWRADGGDTGAAAELAVAQKQFTEIQRISNEQTEAIKELEKEQDLFRGAMNQRLEFYRQLQHISDTVAPWKEDLDPVFDVISFRQLQKKQADCSSRLNGYKTKHNYLTNLRQENEQEDVKHECIICQDNFEIGVLTSCGHKYCKECINQWWHQHRSCPLCKMRLRTRDFKDINFKPSEIKAQEENHGQILSPQGSSPGSSSSSIYSDISDSVMKEIKTIDLSGSYGTKVDMIARHLIWIRNNDPGAKSIVFSQFGDFLEVLREALKTWKIGATSIRDKNGIDNFLADPAVECFLLDAKSDSSGLNLVNATYVFLCEPLINPAIELQAIARVHRIGQRRPTTVFMYLVSDTVEEAIYDISVGRRLEHMGKSSASTSGSATPILQEKTLDAANSLELEAAPVKQLLRKKGDGEVVQAEDLWNCLFGKPRRKQQQQQRVLLDREVSRHLRADAAEGRAEAASAQADDLSIQTVRTLGVDNPSGATEACPSRQE